MNYLGDLMLSLAFCLTCGFTHVLPFFYIGQTGGAMLAGRDWRLRTLFSRLSLSVALVHCPLVCAQCL